MEIPESGRTSRAPRVLTAARATFPASSFGRRTLSEATLYVESELGYELVTLFSLSEWICLSLQDSWVEVLGVGDIGEGCGAIDKCGTS